MKFLQIHTFYRRYQNEFYRRKQHLAQAPFHEQTKALVENGFGAGHLFSPYMRELGYDAQFIVANCPQAQAQWAREHNISTVTPQNWTLEIARHQVEALKPDILFLRNPLTFDSHFLRSLVWKPAVIIGWQAAAIPSNTDIQFIICGRRSTKPMPGFLLKRRRCPGVWPMLSRIIESRSKKSNC